MFHGDRASVWDDGSSRDGGGDAYKVAQMFPWEDITRHLNITSMGQQA